MESVTLQVGDGHQWFFLTCDGWLLSYKLEVLPGVLFKPADLENCVRCLWEKRKEEIKKSKRPDSEN